MYQPKMTRRFEKQLKLSKKRQKNMDKLKSIMKTLCSGKSLPAKNKDHLLIGDHKDFRECHIEPDWLLIYKIDDSAKEIIFTALGSHSDLF